MIRLSQSLCCQPDGNVIKLFSSSTTLRQNKLVTANFSSQVLVRRPPVGGGGTVTCSNLVGLWLYCKLVGTRLEKLTRGTNTIIFSHSIGGNKRKLFCTHNRLKIWLHYKNIKLLNRSPEKALLAETQINLTPWKHLVLKTRIDLTSNG